MEHSNHVEDFETAGTGAGAAQELFALTDEQILEMEPEVAGGGNGVQQSGESERPSLARQADLAAEGVAVTAPTSAATNPGSGVSAEPPRWLAEMMADPRSGGEARDFWNGVTRAREDAAAYREVFAKPEVAREAAQRVRVLEDIDRAYFTGDAGERSRLAATMMREDPTAFREMVITGLRMLEEAESGRGARSEDGSRLARAFSGADRGTTENLASAGNPGGAEVSRINAASGGLRNSEMGGALGRADGSTLVAGKHAGAVTDTHVAAYAVFEKSANEDLERSVGGVIERTLRAALPGAQAGNDALKGRLVNSIQQDVEKALQGDRELGERVRQILSGRRLDNATRAQVVRVIGERAEQLVPGAAKKILSDWTQTTVASHRERSGRAAEAASRTEVATVAVDRENGDRARAKESARDGKQRGVDYRKVTDEQILAM